MIFVKPTPTIKGAPALPRKLGLDQFVFFGGMAMRNKTIYCKCHCKKIIRRHNIMIYPPQGPP